MAVHVVAFIGHHGQGKTFALTEWAREYELKGWRVVSNYGYVGGESVVTSADVLRIVKRQACAPRSERWPTVIALDEAGVLWDPRKPQSFPEAVRVLVSQCRKLHVRIGYTCQDYGDVEVKVRRQTHQIVVCRAVGEVVYDKDPLTGESLVRPRLFVRRCLRGVVEMPAKLAALRAAPAKESVCSWLRRFDARIADLYDDQRLIENLGWLAVEEVSSGSV